MIVSRIILVFLACLCNDIHEVYAGKRYCNIQDIRTHTRRATTFIDADVQPCNDFHEYACGNWRVPYGPRSLHAHDTLSEMRADNKLKLIDHIEKAAMNLTVQPTSLTLAERRIVNFYTSCLDELIGNEKKSSIAIYTQTLRQMTRWPILDPDFDEQTAKMSFNWEKITGQLRHYGVQALWQLRVQPNWQAAEQKIFYITAPTFDMLKPHKLAESYDDDSVYMYERYVKYLMFDLGMKVRQAKKIAEEVVDFEKQLMSLITKDDSVILREPQTLLSLTRELPDLNLLNYFTVLLRDFNLSEKQIVELIVVADTTYLRKLNDFMKIAKAEAIAKYLLVQFLAHFEYHMHEGSTYMEQKEHCLQQMNKFLINELSIVFFKLQHGEDSEQVMMHMRIELKEVFAKLKVQFEKLLNSTKIFEDDALTKVLGLEKLRAMRLLLPQLESVTNFSDSFEIVDDYNLNLINLWKWHAGQTLGGVLQLTTSNSDADAYGPLHVNAYYRLKKNAIEIPIGVLRLPVYHHCMESSNIYGSLGYMIAHELLHGFDYDGLNYDKSGNVANNWGAKSIIQFGIKSKCYLGDRYNNAYTTINENIADSEGLRLALQAFQMHREERNNDPTNMDADADPHANERQLQSFFISFAQTWCGTNLITQSTSATPKASGNTISSGATTSVHAGHRERVNNAVGNFIEFTDAFKCKPDSNMNPPDKCRLW